VRAKPTRLPFLKRNLKLGTRGVAAKIFQRADRLAQARESLRAYMKKGASPTNFLTSHSSIVSDDQAFTKTFDAKMTSWSDKRYDQEIDSKTSKTA